MIMGPSIGIAFGHLPLPRLLDVSPYPPAPIDIPMPVRLLLACLFFHFRTSWAKVYIYLFVVGWQTTHTKSGHCFTVSLWSQGFLVLFFEGFTL